jgi:hypothetical protein
MKKQLIYMLLIIFCLFRCGSKKVEKENEPHVHTVKNFADSTQGFEAIALSDSAQIDMKSDPISIESTIEMSSLLLEEQPALSNIARYIAFGGVFNASVFNMQQNMFGVRMWYCYNPNNNNKLFPEFFLALEHIDKETYDENNPEKLSLNPTFIVPETFKYDKIDYEEKTIEEFIMTHGAITTNPSPPPISQTEITEFSNNFKSLMSIISPRASKPYCKYPVAIFEYTLAYKNFLAAPQPMWVRYYMGLARDPSHKPNYMRPILAGVDEFGKPILRVVLDTDESFLQKSVPPPPHQ